MCGDRGLLVIVCSSTWCLYRKLQLLPTLFLDVVTALILLFVIVLLPSVSCKAAECEPELLSVPA